MSGCCLCCSCCLRMCLQTVRWCSDVPADEVIPEHAQDSDGEVDVTDIFCATCKGSDSTDDNDLLLCDGPCNRWAAYANASFAPGRDTCSRQAQRAVWVPAHSMLQQLPSMHCDLVQTWHAHAFRWCPAGHSTSSAWTRQLCWQTSLRMRAGCALHVTPRWDLHMC